MKILMEIEVGFREETFLQILTFSVLLGFFVFFSHTTFDGNLLSFWIVLPTTPSTLTHEPRM